MWVGGEDAGLVIASQNVRTQLIISTFDPAFSENKIKLCQGGHLEHFV